jgi:hypothetical protein
MVWAYIYEIAEKAPKWQFEGNCYVNSCQTETNMKGMSVVITYQNMNFESWKKPPTKMPMFRLQHSYYKSMGQNISLGKDENNSK